MERRNRHETHSLEREQWLLGEQSASERARTEAALDASERALLTDDDAALRADLFERCPPDQLARQVRARLEVDARRATGAAATPRRYVLGVVLVTACALLALLRTPPSDERGALPAERVGHQVGDRAKGAQLELRVFRQRGAEVERLSSGAQVEAHQVLQLGYARGGYTHAVLLSIDGRGGVTLHSPREPGDSTALPARNEHLLSEAYELDDAPVFERFILVAAREPLDAAQVVAAARAQTHDLEQARTAALAVEVPHEQRSVLVWKSMQ